MNPKLVVATVVAVLLGSIVPAQAPGAERKPARPAMEGKKPDGARAEDLAEFERLREQQRLEIAQLEQQLKGEREAARKAELERLKAEMQKRHQQHLEQMKQRHQEMLEQMKARQQEWREKHQENVAERKEQQAERHEERKERGEERKEQFQDRREEHKERVEGRREELKDRVDRNDDGKAGPLERKRAQEIRQERKDGGDGPQAQRQHGKPEGRPQSRPQGRPKQ